MHELNSNDILTSPILSVCANIEVKYVRFLYAQIIVNSRMPVKKKTSAILREKAVFQEQSKSWIAPA